MINCQREKQISIIYYRADTQNRDTWKNIVNHNVFWKQKILKFFSQTARDVDNTLIMVMDYRKQLDKCKISVIHVQALRFAVTKKI